MWACHMVLQAAVRCMAFSPKGHYALSAAQGERSIALWRVPGKQKRKLQAAAGTLAVPEPVLALSTAPITGNGTDRGFAALAVTEGGRVFVWRCFAEGKLLKSALQAEIASSSLSQLRCGWGQACLHHAVHGPLRCMRQLLCRANRTIKVHAVESRASALDRSLFLHEVFNGHSRSHACMLLQRMPTHTCIPLRSVNSWHVALLACIAYGCMQAHLHSLGCSPLQEWTTWRPIGSFMFECICMARRRSLPGSSQGIFVARFEGSDSTVLVVKGQSMLPTFERLSLPTEGRPLHLSVAPQQVGHLPAPVKIIASQ